ncbi:MAG: M23 family metallopeptidase [Campylobacteraceae bacterium]|jgi:murein DD-endopeptidase MepM/ murein hydrolase activator NlpD|nr:M23 family metallopeptidase [Campylobacteraceae bacterium]MBT3881907.1 M23 family metallopeptidase [Campylobacteraceae bacterium]MBT4030773.1 M23 family metallopeptidase [Campylobacteraceae bacterium]MBT4178738.1 M23 family metallopeptidase [Campylobacteraceae bacterium]MBT4572101.1 M23 family metallopeptidase [Campylobacteraceae bacterium]
MKDKLTITISDVNKTKSYTISQLVKKIFLWLVVFVFLVIIAGSLIVRFLNQQLIDVKHKKQQEIRLLTQKEKTLLTQNKLYSLKIKDKVQDINELESKLEDIEDIIGIKKDDTTSLIQRATLAKITSSHKKYMFNTIPSGKPLKKTKVTAKFGFRIHPITKKKKFHQGIDLRAKRGTKVYSTADGVVRYVQTKDKGNWGRTIIIAHNFGFETVYAHLKKSKVKVGDVIKKGDIIGLSGNSGRSTGPHLHYEVRYASRILDPSTFMSWNMKNYENIFEKQRRVKWDSLVNLISHQVKIQAQQ